MLVSDPTMVKKKVVFFRNSLGYSTVGNFLENDNKMLMAHSALGDRYTFCVQKMPLFFFFLMCTSKLRRVSLVQALFTLQKHNFNFSLINRTYFLVFPVMSCSCCALREIALLVAKFTANYC